MERIEYITGLREFEGLSLRAISERTGHHFDTIKKYVEREDWNEKLTAAIIDRIIHHSHLLDFSCRDSRRLMNSFIKFK